MENPKEWRAEEVARAAAEAERIRIVTYLSYDTVYSDDFCLRCSHCPSNCECSVPVHITGWTPDDKLKALKVALFQEDFLRDAIHFNALLDVLNRLRSRNRNPDRDWYLGWNSALDCLTNDIKARRNPSAQATRSAKRALGTSNVPKTWDKESKMNDEQLDKRGE